MEKPNSQSLTAASTPTSPYHDFATSSTQNKLTTPVSKNNPLKVSTAASSSFCSALPAIIFQECGFIRSNRSPHASLTLNLKTPRLNDIHQHLWLAGLPKAARPLHRQKLLGRSILITEDPDEHLVWYEAKIFIKPLPDHLLDYNFWTKNLCSDRELHKSACGLLLSYAWLVCYQSDLLLAKEIGLLPENLAWPDWIEFLDIFLDNINLITLSDVNERYKYGELRLSRLNSIYRLMPPAYSLNNLFRGYRAGSTWYDAYFARHFKWMVTAFLTLTVFLSALQVGLATSSLQQNETFQKVSYGFAITSLVAVVISVVLILSVWLGLFSYHLISTWHNDRAVARGRCMSVPAP
jgi:hypothetical protein